MLVCNENRSFVSCHMLILAGTEAACLRRRATFALLIHTRSLASATIPQYLVQTPGCLPNSTRRLQSGRHLLQDQDRIASNPAHSDREDRTEILSRNSRWQASPSWRLCNFAAPAVYDTRQQLASSAQVHVYWRHESPRSETDCHDT